MIKQKTVYNFFKFLKDKRGEKMPFDIKLNYFPQEITKEDLKEKDNYLKYMIIFEPYSLTREELNIEGDLDLTGLAVTELPNNLTVTGNLDIGFTSIRSLPDDIQIGRSLFAHQSKLEHLPDNFTVNGNLDISDCRNIELPDNFTVGGNLYISDTNISDIPNNLKVGGFISIFNTPLQRRYTFHRVEEMIKEKGGHVVRGVGI